MRPNSRNSKIIGVVIILLAIAVILGSSSYTQNQERRQVNRKAKLESLSNQILSQSPISNPNSQLEPSGGGLGYLNNGGGFMFLNSCTNNPIVRGRNLRSKIWIYPEGENPSSTRKDRILFNPYG